MRSDRSRILALLQNHLVSHLHTDMHGTIDPASPSVGEIATSKVDIAVGALESREVLGGEVGGQVTPRSLGEFVLLPIMSYLELVSICMGVERT